MPGTLIAISRRGSRLRALAVALHVSAAAAVATAAGFPASETIFPATTRASFAYFNTREDIDVLVSAVEKAIELFK